MSTASSNCCAITATCLALLFPSMLSGQVVVGGTGTSCLDDPGCINRLHPDIPMAASARPDEEITFRVWGPSDLESMTVETLAEIFGALHPLAGPVYIEGADRGDTLAITLHKIAPGKAGVTIASAFGFASDEIGAEGVTVWQLNEQFAVSDDLPGIRIPNASFPGIVTTLPGEQELAEMLAREAQLLAAGGQVFLPVPDLAVPSEICGPEGSAREECLRTIPPREHGGNLDIRYVGKGATVYLPCFVEGCGLAIGDTHFAQGDGEVAGTAIEMGADVTVTVEILEDGPDLSRGPHYEGPAELLRIPSRRFYAVTGLPLKRDGEVPPEIAYLAADKVAGLTNLSNDINLAARNALAAMVDHIVSTYGYSRQQAYVIASVAVDLRIGQLVDSPNVVVTAILPLDIFSRPPHGGRL